MKRVDLIKKGGFVAGEHLKTEDVDVPKLADSELLIDVKASAINPVDWKMAEYGFLLPEELPAALGCDVAGVVEEGPDDMKGKRVVTYLGASKVSSKASRGAFVEKVAVDKDITFEIPDSMSFAQAATQPVGALTALLLLNALDGIKEGDWVLVWGASSSVGFNAVQLAKARGLKVIAVASAKHEKAIMDMGMDAFVDYRKGDAETAIAEVMKGAAGTKLNGAVDCIGSSDSFLTSAKAVKAHGDGALALTVSTIAYGLPDPPEGVKGHPVELGTALENAESRAAIIRDYPSVLKVKPQAIRSVKGKVSAEVVQEAFQISKDGVSGEKVVIEWDE
eukprot:CAMPEP_0119546112 /NCGR_PEP_ID=MMETSP1352-20130426/664_1 /TAXON_ID=265584 /ORGANISM="Stauroneis constricta, Strain CCMP1120" /LENGTH=334 /DNA_ID=CAMNT_0007590777 /DNA_START=106 /DNA_END=1110 /DNA_ORIENTATION=+